MISCLYLLYLWSSLWQNSAFRLAEQCEFQTRRCKTEQSDQNQVTMYNLHIGKLMANPNPCLKVLRNTVQGNIIRYSPNLFILQNLPPGRIKQPKVITHIQEVCKNITRPIERMEKSQRKLYSKEAMLYVLHECTMHAYNQAFYSSSQVVHQLSGTSVNP